MYGGNKCTYTYIITDGQKSCQVFSVSFGKQSVYQIYYNVSKHTNKLSKLKQNFKTAKEIANISHLIRCG